MLSPPIGKALISTPFPPFASGHRVSKLNGLSDFLAKIQHAGDESLVEFSITALTEFVGDREEDALFCLVRAVCEYLQQTKDCSPFSSWLSVAISEHTVHPHALSMRICQVIGRAYNFSSQ